MRPLPAPARSARRTTAGGRRAASRGCARWSAARRGAWGAALLEPEVLLALARHPPADAAALADVPGVGAALAARLGRAILGALDGTGGRRRRQPRQSSSAPRRAGGLAPAAYARASPGCPSTSCSGTPRSPRSPRDVRMAGPRRRARASAPARSRSTATTLLRLIAAHRPDHYLLPMDQGDAEILERIDAGERVFRPGAAASAPDQIFEALVQHLRELRATAA